MNAPTNLNGLSSEMRHLIAQAITGRADGYEDPFVGAFQAVVADLEMLSQARINYENDAVTNLSADDYAEQVYRITRRAKVSLEIARLLEEADTAEQRAKEKRTS